MAKKNTQLDDAIARRGLNMLKMIPGSTTEQKRERQAHNKQVGRRMKSLAGRGVKGSLLAYLEPEEYGG